MDYSSITNRTLYQLYLTKIQILFFYPFEINYIILFISNLIVMIVREAYLSKIRPFIGKDIIKVLTGMRRRGGKKC